MLAHAAAAALHLLSNTSDQHECSCRVVLVTGMLCHGTAPEAINVWILGAALVQTSGPVRRACAPHSRCCGHCVMRGDADAGERIALEANGLSHFTTNTLAPCHRLITRHRLQTARGWLLISVPCYLWQRLNDAGRGAWLLQARPPAALPDC